MKKGFIIFLVLITASFIYASDNTYDISISLILNKTNISEIKNNDKALNILNEQSNIKFSNFEINCLNNVYNLCNQYLSLLDLSNNYIDKKQDNIKFDLTIKNNKTIEEKYNKYSASLDSSILSEINDYIDNSDNSKLIINELKPTFSLINNTLAFSIISDSKEKYLIDALLNKYSCDAFILLSVEEISNYKKLKIEYLDSVSRYTIYNKIIENNLIQEMQEDILLNLISFFNNEYSLLSLKNVNNVLSIDEIKGISKQRLEKVDKKEYDSTKIKKQDLNKININNDYIILKKGEHFFLIQDQFKSEIIKINIIESLNLFEYNGEININESLNIKSMNGLVDFYLNGKYLDKTTSLNLINLELPFYIEAKKENYSSKLIHINKNIESLNFELKPLWLTKSTTIEKAQDDFYSSLLSYILIHFTTLSINTINDSINDNELETALEIFSTSMTFFSSINIANKLISYIKIATK